MLTVWKYEIPLNDEFSLGIPTGAKVLTAMLDPRGFSCLWCQVDTEKPTEKRRFRMAGTGHPLGHTSDKLVYISSFVQGYFVWHVFEVVQ